MIACRRLYTSKSNLRACQCKIGHDRGHRTPVCPQEVPSSLFAFSYHPQPISNELAEENIKQTSRLNSFT